MLRDQQLARLRDSHFDVCIVGAGINGAVSAAALTARGLNVALVDRGDFAGETSSQSSNLAWGGIKYLENREFGLVWKLCKSRNELMDRFPSTVREIRFLTTVERDFRFPAFFVYLGALLYWGFGRFKTRAPAWLSRHALKHRERRINERDAVAGVEYSDCYLHDNDARFTWNFVRGAMDRGCVAVNYLRSTGARRADGRWLVDAHDETSDASFQFSADVLINACGPYADRYNETLGVTTEHRHIFSKGIHLIVDRNLEPGRILTFFASDGRLFFVMPMGPKTCIGTTDTRVDDPQTSVTSEDRDFVLANANELLSLEKPLTRDDIVAERCGVRPLAVQGGDAGGDWISLSRKHAIDVDSTQRTLSIFGGKITDCINVGDEVCDHVTSLGVNMAAAPDDWYGEPGSDVRKRFFAEATAMDLEQYARPDINETLAERLWRRYGGDAFGMLESIRNDARMAERVIEEADYLRCEIEYTAAHEMVVKLDDFLRRRSKISLVVRNERLRASAGLVEACNVFFPDRAEQALEEYFGADRMR